MSTVKPGDSVQVHYEGRLEDGEVFDSSKGRDPLQFAAGSGQIISGFSKGVVGMAVGERKTLTLEPSEAYGEHDPKMVQRADRTLLPEGVKVGDRLQAQAGEQAIQVLVTELDDDGATLDANHPLAGKTLVFDVELVALVPSE